MLFHKPVQEIDLWTLIKKHRYSPEQEKHFNGQKCNPPQYTQAWTSWPSVLVVSCSLLFCFSMLLLRYLLVRLIDTRIQYSLLRLIRFLILISPFNLFFFIPRLFGIWAGVGQQVHKNLTLTITRPSIQHDTQQPERSHNDPAFQAEFPVSFESRLFAPGCHACGKLLP